MFRVVLFQFVTALVAAALLGAVAGAHAALFALLGGLACTVPNGMFALHLALLVRKRQFPGGGHKSPAAASPATLTILLGEFFKVALTAGLLALIILGFRNVVWSALMISVGAVLMVQPLALSWRAR
jgi:F0F1-type ATP synthase assembly protein I